MSLNHYLFPTTCLLLSAFQSDTTFFIILDKDRNFHPDYSLLLYFLREKLFKNGMTTFVHTFK